VTARRPPSGGELRLERLDWRTCDWERMDSFADRHVFQSREWVSFLAETHLAEPVVAGVKEGQQTVGYFTGLVIRRFGVRILGSPFPGWGTDYLGFNLDEGVGRRRAMEALAPFAWRALGCHHLEVRDRLLTPTDLEGLAFCFTPKVTFEVDLRRSEEELFRSFASNVRRNIRKAERIGITVEEARDAAFASDYHAQLEEVFARQSLAPPYGVDRVRALIRNLKPSGKLLLLRARDPEGRCIATLISPAMNATTYFWGGASWRADQHMRPNELLWWYAARYWKQRGITAFDLGGGGDYKRKYRPEELMVPLFRASRGAVIAGLRNGAERGFALKQRALYEIHHPLRARTRR
jgi:Acetyltransferase (GNAT) domain